MTYSRKELQQIIAISKQVTLEGDTITIKGKVLSPSQLFNLIKKLHFYLELDERCIDIDGPQFKKTYLT